MNKSKLCTTRPLSFKLSVRDMSSSKQEHEVNDDRPSSPTYLESLPPYPASEASPDRRIVPANYYPVALQTYPYSWLHIEDVRDGDDYRDPKNEKMSQGREIWSLDDVLYKKRWQEWHKKGVQVQEDVRRGALQVRAIYLAEKEGLIVRRDYRPVQRLSSPYDWIDYRDLKPGEPFRDPWKERPQYKPGSSRAKHDEKVKEWDKANKREIKEYNDVYKKGVQHRERFEKQAWQDTAKTPETKSLQELFSSL